MSDEDGKGSLDLAGIVTDQVTEQLDASELLGGGSIQEQIDAGALGASVGSEFGARVGREFGEEIGGNVHETIASGLKQGKKVKEIAGDVKTAIREAIVGVLSRITSRDALASGAEMIGSEELGDQVREAIPQEGVEDALDGAEDAIGGTTEEVEEAAPDLVDEDEDGETADEDEDGETADEDEDDGEATEDDEEESEDGADLTDKVDEATPDVLGGDEETPDAEDLEGLRRETLEDFLDVMSYRDLQSVAKDVGVKANLSREEMTEEIVETVAEGE